jgi:acyl carrier protein
MEKIIINAIYDTLENKSESIDADTVLIGAESPLDSMSLISLCLRLEEKSEELGFEFDWSGETMSKSKSMFRSVKDLSIEFERQKNLK